MGSMQSLLNIATAVIIFAALAAGIYVAFKGSYNKARIEALREDNTDLRARVDDQDREIERLRNLEKANEVQLRHIEKENDLLKEMVLQRADVGAVAVRLDEHHEQAMEAWSNMTAAIKGLKLT